MEIESTLFTKEVNNMLETSNNLLKFSGNSCEFILKNVLEPEGQGNSRNKITVIITNNSNC